MKLLRFKDKDGKTTGWSTSEALGMDIDGKSMKSEWVDVEGDIDEFFKEPKKYKVDKIKAKGKDKNGNKTDKEVYKFNKKSKD